jgi:uncharacterized membrane-anchored protein YhcB (DUF1043 family)
MKTGTIFAVGCIAGVVIGAFVAFEAPAANAFLTLPLKWFTEDLHPFPSDSLANLIVAWPLWFIYWGCLGAVVGLLLRAVIRRLTKSRRRDEGKPQ